MKVAYLALAPFISGSERSLQQILSHVHKEGVKPVLICPPDSPLLMWAKDQNIVHYGVNIYYTSPLSNPFQFLKTQLQLLRIFKKEKIELIHSNQLWSYPVASKLAKLLNIKRVCHFRDPLDDDSNWWLRSGLDMAVFISKHIEQNFKDSITITTPKQNTTLINPVSISPPLSDNELTSLHQSALAHFQLDKNKITLGFIGQLSDVKGVFETIEALSYIQHNNWQFLIAGEDTSTDKAYKNKCRELAKQKGIEKNITFCGFVDNTSQFYQAVELVIMLPKREPLGRAPLEAASNYTRARAANVDGLPETIVNGKTGWLTPIKSTEDIAKTLDSLLNKNLFNTGKEARGWVETIANPNNYVKALVREYKKDSF